MTYCLCFNRDTVCAITDIFCHVMSVFILQWLYQIQQCIFVIFTLLYLQCSHILLLIQNMFVISPFQLGLFCFLQFSLLILISLFSEIIIVLIAIFTDCCYYGRIFNCLDVVSVHTNNIWVLLTRHYLLLLLLYCERHHSPESFRWFNWAMFTKLCWICHLSVILFSKTEKFMTIRK